MQKVKRRIYLISPKFQIKFSLYICAIVFTSSLFYPFTLYDLLTYFAKAMPKYESFITDKKDALIFIIVLMQLGFSALVFIISIFFSHKLAGPIFKMKKILSSIRQGNLDDRITLRKGDYFGDLAEEINTTLDKIGPQKSNSNASEINMLLKDITEEAPEALKSKLNTLKEKITGL